MVTIDLTTALEDYLTYATEQRAQPDWLLPVFDPSAEHEWPRRIATRLGVPVTQVPASTGSAPLPEPAGFAREGRDDHLVVAFSDEAEFCAPALVFAQAKGARLVHAGAAGQVSKAAAKLPPGGYLTIVGAEQLLEFGLFSWDAPHTASRTRTVRPATRCSSPGVGRTLRAAEDMDMQRVGELSRAGAVFLASETTGVFCHPTRARARRITPPHRVAFGTAQATRRAGFRACRSCRPAPRAGTHGGGASALQRYGS